MGEGLGQLVDLLHAERNICRDFFFRVCMVEEGLQQRTDFLPLGCVVKLLGDILHRLSIVLSVAHAGAVKFPDKAQHLGGHFRVGVCRFFFLRRFLFGRHREYGRILRGRNRHLRGVGHLLNPVPNLLGHFFVVNLHRAIRRNMGNRAIVPVNFFQPVPNSQPISQMPEPQIIGFLRFLHSLRRHRLLFLCKQGKSALTVCGQILKCPLPQIVHPVILRRSLPDRKHHLIDFFHAGRVVELRLNELYTFPIIKAIRIGVGLLLGNILKEGSDVLCELVFLILGHGGPVIITQEPALCDHGADALLHRIPFQFHFGIGF